jgi:hypothetical protein
MLGYVFWNDNDKHEELNRIKTLFVGGDTRYGLGKISKVSDSKESDTIFGKPTTLNKDNPEIKSKIAWAHASNNNHQIDPEIFGAKESLVGWDRDKLQGEKFMWSPGSYRDQETVWSIESDGYWSCKKK